MGFDLEFPIIHLVREWDTGKETISRIYLNHISAKTAFCYALEPPWLGNNKRVSCIPCGWYRMRCIEHHKFGRTLWVLEVPKRSGIYFHVGNTTEDTAGCILPGLKRTERTVIDSEKALRKLVKHVTNNDYNNPRRYYLHVAEAFQIRDNGGASGPRGPGKSSSRPND